MGSGTFNVLDRCCFYKHTKERKWKGRDFYEYICHICYICFVCPYVLRYLGLSGVLQFVWLIEPKKWLGPQEALESRFSHVFIPIDVSRCYVSSSRCPIYHLPSNQVIIVLKYLLFISQRFVSKPRSPFITAKHWEEVAGMWDVYSLPFPCLVRLYTVSYNVFEASLPLVGITPAKRVSSCRLTSWVFSGPWDQQGLSGPLRAIICSIESWKNSSNRYATWCPHSTRAVRATLWLVVRMNNLVL